MATKAELAAAVKALRYQMGFECTPLALARAALEAAETVRIAEDTELTAWIADCRRDAREIRRKREWQKAQPVHRAIR